MHKLEISARSEREFVAAENISAGGAKTRKSTTRIPCVVARPDQTLLPSADTIISLPQELLLHADTVNEDEDYGHAFRWAFTCLWFAESRAEE